MKRKILAILLALSLMSGCSFDWLIPDEPDASAAPANSAQASQPLVPVIGSARSSLFGLAWSPADTAQPLSDRSRYNQDVYKLVYEPLFTMDESFNPVPVLCESITTGDNTVFLLTLKQGVLFHNEKPLTSADVVYSLNQARLSSSLFSDRLRDVKAIVPLGENQVEITLLRPLGRFSALLDIPIIADKSASGKIASGTGPFMFVFEDAAAGGQSAETETALSEDPPAVYLRASPVWRGGAQPVSRIELVRAAAPDALIYGFELGSITLLSADPFDASDVSIRASFESWSYPTARMHFLGYNTNREPFNSSEFRRAVSYAIDRAAIGEDVLGGYFDEAVLPFPEISGGVSDYVKTGRGFDLRETARLFGELGVADEDSDGVMDYPVKNRRVPFAAELLVCSENLTACSAAESVAAMLSDQGLPMTLRRLPYKNYITALEAGDFDMYYGLTQLSGSFDPGIFLKDGELWYGGFTDADLSRLYGEMQAAAADTLLYSRNAFYLSFLEKAVISPILFTRRRIIASRGVLSNPTPTDSSLFYNWENWTINID